MVWQKDKFSQAPLCTQKLIQLGDFPVLGSLGKNKNLWNNLLVVQL